MKTVSLREVEAMSSDEDGDIEEEDAELNEEAMALRQAIADGAFNHLLSKGKGKPVPSRGTAEEAEVNESDDEKDKDDSANDRNHRGSGKGMEQKQTSDAASSGSPGSATRPASGRALLAVTDENVRRLDSLPWAETFVVSSDSPVRFDKTASSSSSTGQEASLGVHDDLNRELVFYNMAMSATIEARKRCKAAGVPFSRPIDFFAEMVKTDGTWCVSSIEKQRMVAV